MRQSPHDIALIRGALREKARYMQTKGDALTLALNSYKQGPRGGCMYKCNHCGESFSLKEVQVDHIKPVVPVDREIEDWNEYINRLFCGVEDLQVLCKPCHLIKSNKENKQRREFKAHNKQ